MVQPSACTGLAPSPVICAQAPSRPVGPQPPGSQWTPAAAGHTCRALRSWPKPSGSTAARMWKDSCSCRTHAQSLLELAPAQGVDSCQEIKRRPQLQGTHAGLCRLAPGQWEQSCLKSGELCSCRGAYTAKFARSLPQMVAIDAFTWGTCQCMLLDAYEALCHVPAADA